MQPVAKPTNSNLNHQQPAVINILGVSSSMRENSHSIRALNIVLQATREKYGAKTRLIDLRQTKLPIYDPTRGLTRHNGMKRVVEAVNWADAFVLASPDYHGSMSGVIKNFLDHFWEEFAGKTFAYLCASHEKGLTVMDQMRTAVRQCYGWSMPYGVSVNGDEDFNTNGKVINKRLATRLEILARDLVVYGTLIRIQFLHDLEGNEPYTFAARYR